MDQSKPNNHSTWIIIPTYNEKGNISKMIHRLFWLNIPNLSVLIVDDSSPDGTGSIVRSLQKKYQSLHLEQRSGKNGLGTAYIHGFKYALEKGASALVQMDADFSHSPDDVSRLLNELKKYDLVLGSRYVNGISVINWPLKRLLISMGGNLYARLVTGLPYKDSTGGFKAWRSPALKKINLDQTKGNGYAFQISTTYAAWKKGFKITEVPIVFTERTDGKSKMSKAIVWEAIWLVWKLRIFGI